jgi:hypothetical protein
MDKKQLCSLIGTGLSLAGIAINLIAGNLQGKAAKMEMQETVAKEVAKQLNNNKGSLN